MHQKTFHCKVVTCAAIAIVTGMLLFAASLVSAASMTVYQKGKTPLVFNLSAVSNLSFSGASPVLNGMKKQIVFSMNAANTLGRVRFTLSGAPGSLAELKIFSINGRLLYSTNCRMSAEGMRYMTSPQMTPGMYIARFINEKHVITQRVSTF